MLFNGAWILTICLVPILWFLGNTLLSSFTLAPCWIFWFAFEKENILKWKEILVIEPLTVFGERIDRRGIADEVKAIRGVLWVTVPHSHFKEKTISKIDHCTFGELGRSRPRKLHTGTKFVSHTGNFSCTMKFNTIFIAIMIAIKVNSCKIIAENTGYKMMPTLVS